MKAKNYEQFKPKLDLVGAAVSVRNLAACGDLTRIGGISLFVRRRPARPGRPIDVYGRHHLDFHVDVASASLQIISPGANQERSEEYEMLILMVGATGFEPATPCSQSSLK